MLVRRASMMTITASTTYAKASMKNRRRGITTKLNLPATVSAAIRGSTGLPPISGPTVSSVARENGQKLSCLNSSRHASADSALRFISM